MGEISSKTEGFFLFRSVYRRHTFDTEKAPRQFGDRTRGFGEVQCFTIKPVKGNEKVYITARGSSTFDRVKLSENGGVKTWAAKGNGK
ncbi:hypothetical protein [Spirosoma utsteinense]|uniref:hypothetical protein n=1 Tax=Spirosoma utsteinense TaxID=2585773 RepID=UPI001648D009|nr:hypothetical protein [Spirosoma utsteinense]MBC3787300.1 hypothetical protein [Spirosoma utsteinense]